MILLESEFLATGGTSVHGGYGATDTVVAEHMATHSRHQLTPSSFKLQKQRHFLKLYN